MPHPNEILLREAYEAQARGDIDGYMELLSDDFVLHIQGRSQIAGDYRGKMRSDGTSGRSPSCPRGRSEQRSTTFSQVMNISSVSSTPEPNVMAFW